LWRCSRLEEGAAYDAAEVVFVTLLGPWFEAVLDWTKGRYVFSVAYGLPGIASALILPAAWILLALRRRVRQRAQILVVDREHLESFENRVRILSNRWRGATILAPQATVVEVSDQLWKGAVRAGLKKSDYILVDVSQATESLLWELEGAEGEQPSRAFTAEEKLFANWTGSPAASPTEMRAHALLSGREVLGYAGSRRLDRKRFRKSLIRCVDNMFPEPSQHLKTKE
jgi:hypothetical protein